MKSKAKFRIGMTVAAVIVAVFGVSMLWGCSLFGDYFRARFTKSSISVAVDEQFDLATIIDSNTFSYTLRSSSPDIASVEGTILTAHKEGIATVTCKTSSNTSSLRVTVNGKNSISVATKGELVQTLGQTSPVSFTTALKGSESFRSSGVMWYKNGVPVVNSYMPDGTYELAAQTQPGEYTVKASVTGQPSAYVENKVRVYSQTDATGSYDGEIEQSSAPYSAVTLSADVDHVTGNPADHIVWRVDGAVAYEGASTEFDYVPTAGTHAVTLEVNGVQRTIDGAGELIVSCEGSIVPTDVNVVFDNMYPHIYVTANVKGAMQVEITSPVGAAMEYSQNNPLYSSLFDENGFDARGKITLCASGNPAEYKIRVKSLGDGGALKESEYGDYYTFTQLPQAARSYIEDKYDDRDHYITSDEEYVNLFEYSVINRPKSGTKSKIEFECYVGYELTTDVDDLWEYAFNIGATSGSYSGFGPSLNGKILRTEFSVDTINTPKKQTYGGAIDDFMGKYTKQLHSNIPHINYDENKYRPDNYVFPIDRLDAVQTGIKYSDELYLAAENNTRPVPTSGSSAATVYELARDILKKIVTDDMTDAQKAHAIYDWVMWQVTYDTPATEVRRDGESYSAYYLEGVFGNGVTQIGGVTYYPYAVCDGMSKAYSLLCNIEGIPCKRVSGMAGDGADYAGGHAWNKVMIDGEWYIVDCTWGDAEGDLDINGRESTYEMGLHEWLFVTDDYAESTHYEPYMFEELDDDWGKCNIVYAPRTAATRYDVYGAWEYNGTVIDCDIKGGQSQEDRIREIVTAFANAYVPRNSIKVPGRGNGLYSIDYESIEIHFSTDCSLGDNRISRIVSDAVSSVLPNADVEAYAYGEIVFVMLRNK